MPTRHSHSTFSDLRGHLSSQLSSYSRVDRGGGESSMHWGTLSPSLPLHLLARRSLQGPLSSALGHRMTTCGTLYCFPNTLLSSRAHVLRDAASDAANVTALDVDSRVSMAMVLGGFRMPKAKTAKLILSTLWYLR
ncbi:hypothetical protein BDV96DRAFT_118916 [Lophiotrema nucula]|uniref:Uncharacterized protein n=1 Tax=Lophiotrema nucula TaxID=690887 RepID=A0A6A5Z389_9PLEO|nr:hypothetical protein BDV96DRAFT_118916 [Lophiotrema nucula]